MSLFVFLVSPPLLSPAGGCGVQGKLFSTLTAQRRSCAIYVRERAELLQLYEYSAVKLLHQIIAGLKKLKNREICHRICQNWDLQGKTAAQPSQPGNNNDAGLEGEVQQHTKGCSFVNQSLINHSAQLLAAAGDVLWLRGSFRCLEKSWRAKGNHKQADKSVSLF